MRVALNSLFQMRPEYLTRPSTENSLLRPSFHSPSCSSWRRRWVYIPHLSPRLHFRAYGARRCRHECVNRKNSRKIRSPIFSHYRHWRHRPPRPATTRWSETGGGIHLYPKCATRALRNPRFDYPSSGGCRRTQHPLSPQLRHHSDPFRS